MGKYQYHFGRKFFQRKNGYWQCTKDSTLYAHRWIWINHFGEIPDGMDIHHRDNDPSNNDISNLLMLTASQHVKFHWRVKKFEPNQLLLAI